MSTSRGTVRGATASAPRHTERAAALSGISFGAMPKARRALPAGGGSAGDFCHLLATAGRRHGCPAFSIPIATRSAPPRRERRIAGDRGWWGSLLPDPGGLVARAHSHHDQPRYGSDSLPARVVFAATHLLTSPIPRARRSACRRLASREPRQTISSVPLAHEHGAKRWTESASQRG